jgi:hypothetical protein
MEAKSNRMAIETGNPARRRGRKQIDIGQKGKRRPKSRHANRKAVENKPKNEK